MRILRNFLLSAMLLGSTHSFAMDQVGEEALYKLDRSRARTSSLIKEGTLNIKLTDYLPDEPNGPVYQAHYNYDLTVAFMGRQVGEDDVKLPVKYFGPEFLAELKSKGQIETEEFKAKYLGTSDVTTIDGTAYAQCDLIHLYDINLQKVREMSDFVSTLLYSAYAQLKNEAGSEDFGRGQFENVEIKAAIKQGVVPVIGAAKVDVSAIRQGFLLKAGFDYQAPSVQSE